MESNVAEAYEAMIANVSADPMSYMHLQLRWQQREVMLRDIVDYIASCDAERKQILEEIAEREKGGPVSHAQSDQYA